MRHGWNPGPLVRLAKTTCRALHRDGAWLLAITVLAFLLRVYRLDHLSFWVDEGASAWLAEQACLSTWLEDVHPPLYYALLSGWQIWGHSDWWLRFPSVVFGVAAIPVMYDLGRRLFTPSAGLWSATLVSALYIHVMYSQEARMYSLMVLLYAGAFWGLVVAAREGRFRGWIVYTGSASLLAYTHALGWLYVATLAALFPAVAPHRRPWTMWRPWILANGIVALLFAPYVPVYMRVVGQVASDYWIRPDGPEPPIFSTLFYFTVSPVPPLSQLAARHLGVELAPVVGRWVWFLPVLVVLVLAVASMAAEDRWAVRSLFLAYLLPISALSTISLIVRPVLILRVLLPTLVPVVLMLASFAAATLARPVWRRIGLVAVLAVFLLSTFYSLRYGAKEQWREASRYLQERARATDVLLSTTGLSVLSLLDRYDPRGVLERMPRVTARELLPSSCEAGVSACLDRAFEAYPRGQRVWVVERDRLGGPPTATEMWRASHLVEEESIDLTGVWIARATLR